MRTPVLLSALAFAGCASAPPAQPTAPVQYETASGQPINQVKDPNMDAKRLADARKLGFQVVNQNGEKVYCRTELKTGSHVIKDTTCYTADQMEAIRTQSEQAAQQYLRTNAPVQGR